MERRLAAILAADVVGYTRLIGEDDAGTLRRLTELRQQVLAPLIAEHRGRVVKLMGDGMLVEFASVVDALSCAVAWQNQVAQREAEGDEEKRLQFRIGVNLNQLTKIANQTGKMPGDLPRVCKAIEDILVRELEGVPMPDEEMPD